MRRLLILLAILPTLAACSPFPVHYDCLGSSGCGYSDVKPSAQSIAVSGADRAESRGFQDGRGRCNTSTSTIGFNNESRVVRIFILQLWVPATAPRYRIELRITGSRGPGQVSTADNERFLYDPANGPTVQADVKLVPSPDPIATPPTWSLPSTPAKPPAHSASSCRTAPSPAPGPAPRLQRSPSRRSPRGVRRAGAPPR